ncbi:MAG: PQQ-binding-like beta-propeller repeat protein, partial [Planctomycetes bacterium]|nr:PQQ-binding-like beta-propeller repeat protein [Planctomycetota bacterium]
PPSPREAAEILLPVAEAVAHAHARGVIHRDLKPANILVGKDGRPKLTDFGLARREGESMVSRTGDVMGTPEYMAPEQVEGDPSRIGPASDVYGLGAILYRLLVKRPPFTAVNTVALFRKILSDDPVPPSQANPRVGNEIAAIAMKCLEKSPARRYAGATDLARDLSAYLRGEPIAARPPGLASRLARRIRRHRWRVVTAGLAAIAAFALAWIFAAPATLEVRTTPPGAEVLLDGEEIGTSPVSVTVWPPGTRQMDVRHALCEPVSRSVKLEAGKLHEEVVPLVPYAGVLSVTSDPPDAEIWLDGELAGKHTPAELPQVSAGVHLLALRLADHKEEALQVTIANREEVSVHRALTPTFGTLQVTYHPRGAKIEIRPAGGETREGTSPAVFEKLPLGPCEIRIWTTGEEPDVTETRDVVAGSPVELAGEVKGTLTIHVHPGGSRGTLELVAEEGDPQVKREFSAPLVEEELPVGEYRLRLTGPGDPEEELWSAKEDTLAVRAERPAVEYYRLIEKWRVLWTCDMGGANYSSPALGDLDGDGVPDAVVGSSDRKIHAVSGRTGRGLWGYETGSAVYARPALGDLDGDGVPDAVVGSCDNKLHAVSGRTGQKIWAYTTLGWVISSPALGDLDGDGVPDAVVGSNDKKLHAVSGRTGQCLWAYEAGSQVISSPALADLDGDGVSDAVVGSSPHYLHAVSGRGGKRLWVYQVRGVVESSPALADLDGDGVPDAVVGASDKKLHAVSGRTGQRLWAHATDGDVNSSPALADLDGDGVSDAVVGSHDYKIYAVNGRTGERLWAYDTGSSVEGYSPALADLDGNGICDVLVGSYSRNLHALSVTTGIASWTYATGDLLRSPAVADLDEDPSPDVAVASLDGFLYAVSGTTGKRLWRVSTSETSVRGSPSIHRWSPTGDLDGDHVLDAVVRTPDHKVLAVSGRSGLLLWCYDLGKWAGSHADPVVAELDGDGVTDVVLGCFDGKLHAVSGRTGTRLWVREFPASLVDEPGLGDLDGDGTKDAVIPCMKTLYAVSGSSGALLWTHDRPGGVHTPALADLDADGVPDVIVSSFLGEIYAFSGSTWQILWIYRTGSRATPPDVLDLDRDGCLEVVVGTQDGKILALSANSGEVLWIHDTGSNGSPSHAGFGNVDSDPVTDVLFGFPDGKLHAVSGRTGEAIWTMDLGEPIEGRAAVADVDGDGRPEILVPAGSTLHCLRNPQLSAPLFNPGLGIEGTAAQALLFQLARDPGAADRFLDRFPRHEAAGRVHVRRARSRRLAGDVAGAKTDLEAAQAKGLRSVDLYREILITAPEWELPASDPRLAIALGMDMPDGVRATTVNMKIPEHDPNTSPLDSDVLGAAAFQAYRMGRFGDAMGWFRAYFAEIHREAEAEIWLSRTRCLAGFDPELPPADLAGHIASHRDSLVAMDEFDRERVRSAIEFWSSRHPESRAPALPW